MCIAFLSQVFGRTPYEGRQTLRLGYALKRISLVFSLVCLLATVGAALWLPGRYYEQSIYTSEYGVSFYPEYPPKIGDTVTIRLRTFSPAQKVTLITDRDVKIPMTFRQGHWWTKFTIPDDYQEGGHFFTVWIKYLTFLPQGPYPTWSESTFWYQTILSTEESDVSQPGEAIALPSGISAEVEELIPSVTGEAVLIQRASPEVLPLKIKGSQNITFKSRTLIGSREGDIPGTQQNREETLRINVSGRAADTDIEASLYRTSALGVTQLGESDEQISILMRRGSTEVYLGDFDSNFTDTEFGYLAKRMSGGRLKSDHEKWGVAGLYSSPKGQAKYERFYGNNTQGPYILSSPPVVIASERVKVDGVIRKRGDEYTIDYQAGTITFIHNVIDIKSIIEVNYDFRQTVYQHSTYGVRAYLQPWPELKLGATYLNDSDSLSDAEIIRSSMSQEVVNPVGHYLVAVDGQYSGENFSAKTEGAYSAKNYNLLRQGSEESGRAAKLELSGNLGPFTLELRGKRVGAQFLRIADIDPKQDVTEYGGSFGFRPGQLIGAQTDYTYQRYLQGGVRYENSYKTAKAMLTPDRFPSLEYNFNEKAESNDPVTGATIERIITKNAATSIYQLGFLSGSLKGSLERWLRRSPSEEVTEYKRVNVGLATLGLEKLSFAANVELERRDEPDGTRPHKYSGDLNFSFTPSRNAFMAATFQMIDDSVNGPTNVTDLSYRWQPSESLKFDGKYTVNSVNESFPATAETVSKQAGSFSLDWRGAQVLRLRYLYKPNFTRILRTQTLSYNNEQQQAEVNILPNNATWLGILYKFGHGYTVSKNDYPNYALKDRSEDNNSTLYTMKLAPLVFLSTELNYLQENGYTETLISSVDASYISGRSVNNKIDLLIKTSLSEKLSIDSRYAFQKTNSGSGESQSNLTETKTHSASLKVLWTLSDAWTWTLSGAYTRLTDYLLGAVTYTWTPGCGFIFRQGEALRIDGDYAYSRSYQGADTEKHNYSLKARYTVSEFVNWTLTAQHEVSRWPDYRLTDITGNLGINF